MSSASPPPAADPEPGRTGRQNGLRFSAWNLLLLVPLVMLVTPWFNQDSPRLAGLPFFYWYQFLFVLVGVACVWIVYLATRKQPVRTDKPDELSVDDLDEGNRA
jgi:Protein of unknown function (DUF3311)